MQQLTKAEEEVMQVLWQLETAFVKDIVEKFPDPKPAYNTVSTIVRILEKKGVVNHESFGKTHRYYPCITKEEYSRKFLNRFVDNYFSGSYSQLVSFFTKQENLSLTELEILLKELKEHQDE
ncbi:MAG: BlaI/MecI/CopY family transcriptional regulator [Bacteroidota bacterium]